MKPRIVYVHGNETTHWSFGWAKWFKEEVEKLGFETFFETMPDSINTRAEYWLPFLKDHVKVGENDILVGWSSGATAAMRYAESNKILGSVLVSPSYTDLDGDPLEVQSGFYDEPWQWDKIRENQSHLALIYGDDDPYIPQAEFEHIAGQLKPEVIKIHGKGHFTQVEKLKELLEYIKRTYV